MNGKGHARARTIGACAHGHEADEVREAEHRSLTQNAAFDGVQTRCGPSGHTHLRANFRSIQKIHSPLSIHTEDTFTNTVHAAVPQCVRTMKWAGRLAAGWM